MTDKKEQARKLREAADVARSLVGRNNIVLTWLEDTAKELDPPVKERWELVEYAAEQTPSISAREYWMAALAEADKGRISEAKLREFLARCSSPLSTVLLDAIDHGQFRGE
jgi:hypothetical protein